MWMWTEEGAGLGIDVMMKEAYGHSTGSCGDLWGNASISGMNRCDGGWRARNPGLLRSHPMLFAPTQNMPSPGALGAARKVRTHAYAGLISEGTAANNFYVYNFFQHKLWLLNAEVSRFSAEVSELLPSLLSQSHYGAAADAIPTAHATVSSSAILQVLVIHGLMLTECVGLQAIPMMLGSTGGLPTSTSAVPTPGKRSAIQILQMTPIFGPLDDTYLPRSRC